MGSPEIAVPSLKAIVESHHHVVGVVSQPDRPAGRGRELTPPAVALLAREMELPLFQPAKVKENPEFMETLKKLAPDIIIVVAYGRILRKEILNLPPKKCINLHFSLLPKYRGAAPVQWALINGESETGVTTFFITEGIDEGPMIMSKKVPIEPEDNAELLSARLSIAGVQLLMDTLEAVSEGDVPSVPQNHRLATLAPPLKKEDGWIDWSRKATTLLYQIKGMNPWPGTYTFLKGKFLKIHRAEVVPRKTSAAPGEVILAGPLGLEIACGQGTLLLKEVQIEGKKQMEISEFLKGHPLTVGERFENG